MPRRSKIVCTIGPSTDTYEQHLALLRAGMNCARLNFSHGSHEDHKRRYDSLRKAAAELERPLAILLDLQGPKIRVGKVAGEGIELLVGAELQITTQDSLGEVGRVSTSYKQLPQDVRPGDRLLLDDGLLELEAVSVTEDTVTTKVIVGGLLKSKKGINLPGVCVSAPALTEKDREDLLFGLSLGVDYVALSFVRRPDDLFETKALIAASGRDVPLIAKLEKPEAIECLDEIITAADGVMVARGDLGVELRPERVPLLQKQIIEATNAQGKLVITATQMLDSMIENPRPTRAEASDVANAILDGSDAVMLSGETASGAYPIEAVTMMAQIVREVEESPRYQRDLAVRVSSTTRSMRNAIAIATVAAAKDLSVAAIVCYTQTGATAELLSELRPTAPILALTPNPETVQHLALHWGVFPMEVQALTSTKAMIRTAEQMAQSYARPGDTLAISLGISDGGDSNALILHRISE